MEKSYVVYEHVNKSDNKKYIGITCQNPEKRFGKNGSHYNCCPYFYNAIQKYGWDNFEHNILLSGLSKKEACEKEIELIALYKTNDPKYGYNISKGGDGFDSETAKAIWEKNKVFLIERMHLAWTDENKRRKRSELTKERWRDYEYKKKVLESVRKSCNVKIICIETGIIYESFADAEKALNVNHSNICRSIRTGYKCGGYHWKYYDDAS